jgi:micrococcal nuclease
MTEPGSLRRLGLAALVVLAIIAAFPLLAWLGSRDDGPGAAAPSPAPTSGATRAVSQPYEGDIVPPTAVPPTGDGELVEVARVVDGDTIHVDRDGRRVKVRIISLDTPEVGECWFDESKDGAAELLDGERVRIAPDPSQDRVDRYGRELHDVWLPDGRLFAEVMVAKGDARAYVYDAGDPNQYADRIAAAEVLARADDGGLWISCGSVQ